MQACLSDKVSKGNGDKDSLCELEGQVRFRGLWLTLSAVPYSLTGWIMSSARALSLGLYIPDPGMNYSFDSPLCQDNMDQQLMTRD